MSLDFVSLLLGAGSAGEPGASFSLPAGVLTLLRLLVAIPLPVFLGYAVAKWLRMKDYGWRLGLIFATICCSAVILQAGRLNLGVDLKGGAILVYEIDRESLQSDSNTPVSSEQVNWGSLIQALNKRINPAGTKEIVVRRYGDWQVEIIVPEVDPIEIERIKKLISTAGSLEFRIVANERDHPDVFAAAKEQAENPLTRRSRFVANADNKRIGFWARVGREANPPSVRPFKVSVFSHLIRNASTGELIDLPPNLRGDDSHVVEKYLESQGIKEVDILMETDDGYDVTGAHLGMVSRGFDEMMQPSVNFAMKGEGIGRMGGLTGSAIPSGQPAFYRLLGIMLDGELLSAPRVMSTISDRGRITGRFTQPEVDFLVGILQAGSLPAAMKKVPISENQIGAVLGEEEIRNGTVAASCSLLAVILFMLYWYRFPGVIACVGMVANLILTVATMIPIHAPLTLPGLAGLVLTVGMSVDANVLIYERMREELDRGCALRMAIRNGFDRAWATILDSNVTTILSAVILYVVGTDQLKGFGVTLTLGLLISMFTSVFCSRVAFEICERKGVITRLKFRHLFAAPNVDFMSYRYWALAISGLIIAGGLAAAVVRGPQIFAVDFLGGTSVTMILEEPTKEGEIRKQLEEKFTSLKVDGSAAEYSVNRVDVKGQTRDTVWKIDSSLPEEQQLQDLLAETFRVAHYTMAFDGQAMTETRVAVPTGPGKSGKEFGAEKPAQLSTEKPAKPAEPPLVEKPETEAKPKEQSSPPEKPKTEPSQEPVSEKPEREASPPAETKPGEAKPSEKSPAEPAKVEPAKKDEPADKAPKPSVKEADRSQTELPADNVWVMAGAGDFLLLAQADSGDKPQASPPAKDTAGTEAKAPTPTDAPAAEPGPAKPTEKSPEKPVEKPAAAASGGSVAEPAGAPAAKPVGEQPPAALSKKVKERIATVTELTFGQEINGRTVEHRILEAASTISVALLPEDVTLGVPPDDPNWTIDDVKGFKKWKVTLATDKAGATKILDEMKQKIAAMPVWPSSSKIGARVAGDTRVLAVVALLAAFLGIAIYVWIRFQHLIFGLAAVVSLVHDVLTTVAAIAFSFWLAKFLGFLKVEEIKIDLNVIAALLTIVGYSINDTIVIFDRVRELRGKSPDLTVKLFNDSLNQTLSRTILTSLTVFIVVLILYFFGGSGIHSFAYAMVIGTITGCYSTVYIASPVVLWLTPKKKTSKI